jgi:hypothetical protein
MQSDESRDLITAYAVAVSCDPALSEVLRMVAVSGNQALMTYVGTSIKTGVATWLRSQEVTPNVLLKEHPCRN